VEPADHVLVGGLQGGIALGEGRQRLGEVGGGLVATLDMGGHRLGDDGGEAGWEGGHYLGDRPELALHLGGPDGQGVVAPVGGHPGAQPVQTDAELVDVHALIGLAGHLLRGEVLCFSFENTHFGHVVAVGPTGDAEVDQLGGAGGGHHDVAEAHIAVDDVKGLAFVVGELVGVGERAGHAGHQAGDRPIVGGGGGAELALHLGEVGAAHQLHHDVGQTLVDIDLEDLGDVGVGQAGREAGLIQEHVEEAGVPGVAGVDELDDDELLKAAHASELAAKGQRHSAHADLVIDLVASDLAPRGLHVCERSAPFRPRRSGDRSGSVRSGAKGSPCLLQPKLAVAFPDPAGRPGSA